MKRLLFFFTLLTVCSWAKADVDPNFYIYICFGQSNMEGNAQWESQDVGNVDPRFQMLATCNFDSPKRTLGNWYTAECPIVSPMGKLGPTDYFGRTMVKTLTDKKVGVIAVAMGGSPIEMFDKDLYKDKIKQKESNGSTPWWAYLATQYYGGNPYGRIIAMAKKAQQVGVIKGILLHQGESNCGDPNWPSMVKKIYNDMLTDLDLQAADVPLFVGETEYQDMGGGCSYHNTVVAKIPNVIPTGHVVSAKNLPGNGTDAWHFSAAGYRIFGQRYAQVALKLMGIDIEVDEPEKPVIPSGEWAIDRRFTSLEDIGTTPFAIVNEEDGKAIFGTTDQNMSYDYMANAFKETNSGYLFRLEKCSDVTNGYFLRLITPKGTEYQVWGGYAPGYLNSQPITGNCSFVLSNSEKYGNGKHNGQDLVNGAVWQLDCVVGEGWSMKNVGTGKYLKTADAAKYDAPTYFTFCTLKDAAASIAVTNREPLTNNQWYSLDGRKLNGEPTAKGLYIVNGKKIVKH